MLLKTRSSKQEFFLILLVLVLFLVNINNDGLWFVGDAAVHANDGLLYAEYLKNPFRNPIDLAAYEYSYYPSLGLIHYMPLFPFTLAVSYILFGGSFVSAKLVMLFFSLIFVISFYRVMKSLSSREISFLTMIVILFSSYYLKYSNAILEEMPLLALTGLTFYLALKFVKHDSCRNTLLLSTAVFLGFLLKKNYLLVFLTVIIFLYLNRSKIKITIKKALCMFPLLLITPYYALYLVYGAGEGGALSELSKGSFQLIYMFSFYVLGSAEHMGIFLFLIFISALAYLMISKKRRSSFILFFIWFAVSYLALSLIATKLMRYFNILPFFYFFIIAFVSDLFKKRHIRYIIISLILLINLASFSFGDIPFKSGVEDIALEIQEKDPSGNILIASRTEAIFIHFFKINNDHQNRIFRSSKNLYVTNIDSREGVVNKLNNTEEIIGFIDDYCVQYVLIHKEHSHKNPVDTILLEIAQDTSLFDLEKTMIVDKNKGKDTILIFRYRYFDDTCCEKPFELDYLFRPMGNRTISIENDNLC